MTLEFTHETDTESLLPPHGETTGLLRVSIEVIMESPQEPLVNTIELYSEDHEREVDMEELPKEEQERIMEEAIELALEHAPEIYSDQLEAQAESRRESMEER